MGTLPLLEQSEGRQAVLRKGEPVGRLDEEGRFAYSPFWLLNVPPSDRGIAARLPPRAESYAPIGRSGLPAFFENLLPEGEPAARLCRRWSLAPDDRRALLGRIGDDAVGDVTMGTIFGPEDHPRLNRIPASVPFSDAYRILLERQEGSGPVSAIAGAQPKICADRIVLPEGFRAGPGAFLKFTNDERYKEAAHNEAFFMAMAADCGLKAARVEKVQDSAGEYALLVHRFDRRSSGKRTRQLHQEDALQLLDLCPADKYDVTVEDVGEAIRKVVAAWPPTAIELILQFAFGYLIGNHDQHAKNVSVLEAAPGVWTLSPLYDMLSTLAHDGLQPLALTLNGKEEDLTRADFVVLANRFEVREEAVLLRLNRMLAKALLWLGRLGEIGFDPLLTERLTGALLERHAALAG